MKTKALIIIMMLAMAFITTPMLITNSDGATTYTIEGYVVTANSEGNVPLEGVEVTVIYNNVTYYDITDDTGMFIMEGIPAITDLQIMFTLSGYTLRSCPNITSQEESDYYTLDLTNATNLGNNTYMITSEADGMQPAIMSQTSATLTGTVSYSGGYIEGATITLISADTSRKYETYTDSDGTYSITCPTGDYELTVSCNGFISSEKETVTVSENMDAIDITLAENNHDNFFGMDAVHMMLILGVLFGLILSFTMLAVSHRKIKNFSIVDDTHSEKDDDNDLNP